MSAKAKKRDKPRKGRAKAAPSRADEKSNKSKGKLPATPASSVPFGEVFFSRVLPGMVQGCPCPGEGSEPAVHLQLVDGSSVELAQVVALADRYAIFAIFEGVGADGIERTEDDIGLEALPYELIARVSVRSEKVRGNKLGFQLQADGATPRVPALAVPAAAASNGD